MAIWDKITTRGNVEDRRGMGPLVGGGLSLGGIALIAAFTLLSGGNLGDVVGAVLQGAATTPTQSAYTAQDFDGADSYEVFASTVLGSTNEYWTSAFKKENATYTAPKLVLFRGSTNSSCGGADSRVGPHYCPLDHTIYLDETFFEELTNRLGANGGDVAQAYVIAHEVGHNVQNELGISDMVARDGSNAASIKLELQADCYAGLWARSVQNIGVIEPGEINEAIDAAAAVGDDRIQKATAGRVRPETWTHGSSADRVAWFNTGFHSESPSECDTFK